MHTTAKAGRTAGVAYSRCSEIDQTDEYKMVLLHSDTMVRINGQSEFFPAASLLCLGRLEMATFPSDTKYEVIYFTPKFLNVNFTFDYLESKSTEDGNDIHLWIDTKPFYDRAKWPKGIILLQPYTYHWICNGYSAVRDCTISEDIIFWTCRARNMIMEILDIAPRGKPSRSIVDPITEKAMDYVHGRYREQITASEIVEHLGITKRELEACFRIQTGSTFKDYLNQLRITMACRALAYTEIPIDEIAVNEGFSDQAHFTARFKAIKGVTPAQYRRLAVPDRNRFFAKARNNPDM